MTSKTSLKKDLYLILAYCNTLDKSPLEPKRRMCFWEDDGITYIYDSKGQLHAIREENWIIKKGSQEIKITAILIANGFTRKKFTDKIIHNQTTASCTQ